MDQSRKEEIAQKEFGRSYEELDTNEKKAVGGHFRKEEMTEATGGDTHAAYAEMGHKGGETRREQMTEAAGGDTHAAYAEMGQKGGQSTGQSTE